MGDLKFRMWNGDIMSEPFHPWDLTINQGSWITPSGISVHWEGRDEIKYP